LRAGVWWNGVSRPPFIGQGREREDMNKHELPAMKVLQNYIKMAVLSFA
jgi:hypothetical protein